MIRIEAIVTDYIQSAMTDENEFGGFTAFDATVMTVLSPEEMKGQQLTFYHEKNAPRAPALETASTRIAFSMDETLLKGGTQLFAAAIEDLEAI
jgi:hypothetical protein